MRVRLVDLLWVFFVPCFFATVACRSTDAMRQRCLAGETADCEATCKKGIFGEGGCFHAAEQHRARAAFDLKSSDFQQASALFSKSCDGKYADGCLFAAQMLEMPFAPPSDDAEVGQDTMPPLIGDADVVAREKRLSEACSLGSSAGCRRLGDVLVAKNADGATEAYKKYCASTTSGADCTESLTGNVRVFELASTACKGGGADECTKLGAMLYSVDPPRAMRLFASECELRGVAKLVGSAGRFVRLRASEVRRGVLFPLVHLDEPAADAPPVFGVRVDAVNGKRALVEVDRALQRHVAELSPCASGKDAGATGMAKLRLDVDLTGDVFRAVATEGTLPPSVSTCIARSLEHVIAGTTAQDLVTVDVVVSALPPPAPSKP